MTTIQTNVEGLIPSIQSLSLEGVQLTSQITLKEAELANLPDVIRINEEIRDLKWKLRDVQTNENNLREQGKQIMLDNDMKEITTLDGTVVSLHFTPWALVVEEGANVPDEFYKVKTTRDLDKTSLKKAITEGKFSDDKVYIQKDCKFVIKQK